MKKIYINKTIFHGSIKEIKNPIYGYGKKYNDYGLGFYCTEERELAREWAVLKDTNGYVNEYIIDISDLKILNLNDEKYCVLNWLAILIKNREFDVNSSLAYEAKEYILKNFLVDYDNYDVIIGYRADDSYFSFAKDFLNGMISYRQLTNAMKLGNLGNQFVLKSEKAFSKIKFVQSEGALHQIWFRFKDEREKEARREYFDLERNKRIKGDIYIANIIDEEMTQDDLRLR